MPFELPGAVYYITSRGDEQRDIVRDDADRRHFFELLVELSPKRASRSLPGSYLKSRLGLVVR